MAFYVRAGSCLTRVDRHRRNARPDQSQSETLAYWDKQNADLFRDQNFIISNER